MKVSFQAFMFTVHAFIMYMWVIKILCSERIHCERL